MKYAIECSNLNKSFAQQQVLKNISVSIPENCLFFLLGPSGCGKTTLLRIIAGLETADSGSLTIHGQNSSALSETNRAVGMVFQNYALWPHMTVYQHIEFGLKNLKLQKNEIYQRSTEVLELLQIETLKDRFPHQLSGGQQQRVSLARAIALKPKVLLLDEPLSNLDPYLREEMRTELKSVQRQSGLTFIYVTHDRSEALAIADQIAFMSDGQIIQQDSATNIYFNPKNLQVASFLGDTNVFDVNINQSNTIEFEFGSYNTDIDVSLFENPKLLIRPEDIKISKDSNLDYKARANITEITHLGYGSQISLRLSTGKVIKAIISMREAAHLKEQQALEVGFSRSDLQIIQA